MPDAASGIKTIYKRDNSRRERLRVRFRRWLVKKLKSPMLWVATYEARKKYDGQEPLKILVDNTVLGLAITHETRWVTTSIQELNGHRFYPGYAARVPVYGRKNKTREFHEAQCIATLSELKRVGVVELYISGELADERFRQPIGRYRGYGLFDHSLLEGVDRNLIDKPVFGAVGPEWMKLPSAAEQQRRRIRQSGDKLYEKLYGVFRHQLGEKCQDVWHIRTAEVHQCYCFPTTDKSLLKAWKNLRTKSPVRELQTQVLSPSELAEQMTFRPADPIIFSFDGRSAPVDVDEVMPGEKRRPRSKYRSNWG